MFHATPGAFRRPPDTSWPAQRGGASPIPAASRRVCRRVARGRDTVSESRRDGAASSDDAIDPSSIVGIKELRANPDFIKSSQIIQ